MPGKETIVFSFKVSTQLIRGIVSKRTVRQRYRHLMTLPRIPREDLTIDTKLFVTSCRSRQLSRFACQAFKHRIDACRIECIQLDVMRTHDFKRSRCL